MPEDLTGKRVMDIGAWDGYWTIEALHRGASEVIAIDDHSDTVGIGYDRSTPWDKFDEVIGKWDYRDRVRTLDLDINQALTGVWLPQARGETIPFDTILFFGTLYHLKAPLLTLDLLRKVVRPGATIHIETAIIHPNTGVTSPICHYCEANSYGNNPTNYFIPTLECLRAWLHDTGWDKVDAWLLTDKPTSLSQLRGFARAVAV